MFWLVTWTTYGSWLPGDPRGFRTFRGREYVPPSERFAKNGEDIYEPEEYKSLHRRSKELVPDAVKLTESEKRIAIEAFADEIEEIGLNPLIMSVAAEHTHLIAEFGRFQIRPTVGRLKSAATRAIPNPGDRNRLWAVDCHMESLKDGDAVENAYNYVREHEKDGALIRDWTYRPKRV